MCCLELSECPLPRRQTVPPWPCCLPSEPVGSQQTRASRRDTELSSFLSLSGRVPVNILPPRRDFGELLASCITLAGTGGSDCVFPDSYLPSLYYVNVQGRFCSWLITMHGLFECKDGPKFGIEFPFRAKREKQRSISAYPLTEKEPHSFMAEVGKLFLTRVKWIIARGLLRVLTSALTGHRQP